MSEYQRERAWLAGHNAALSGKPKTFNARKRGTITYDDWHDGYEAGLRVVNFKEPSQ